MRFCSNCGAQVPDGTKFCSECGQKMEAPVPQPQETPPQSYIPPVQQSEEAPAPSGNSGSYTPPSQSGNSGSYTPPSQSGDGAYVPPSPPPKTPKAPKQKKAGGGRKIALFAVIGVLVIAALFAIFGGKGGSKADDPNLGRYEGVSCVVMGMDLGAEDEWIELKAKGKAQIFLMGEEYSGTWTLEGEEFTLTQHGDEFTGTLEDGVLTVDFSGMLYTFEKEGAQAGAVLPSPVTGSGDPGEKSAEPTPEALQSPYEWWAGTWYGWAVITDAGGSFTEDIDMAIDVVAELSLNADDNGHLEIKDIYDYPICDVDVSFSPGNTEYGILTCGEGSLWDFFATEPEEFPVAPGDWTIDPSASMVSEFDHMICFYDTVYSPDNGWFDYYFFLRPWGMDWEDVRVADTSEMLYDDMMPLNYDDWYLPQLGESGAGADSTGDAAGTDLSGDYGKSSPDADGVVDFDTLKAGFDWLRYQTGYENGYGRPTYEEIAEQLGTDGKKTHESSWEEDYHVYEWVTAGGDFLLVSFNVQADGSETWNSSSWSSSLND